MTECEVRHYFMHSQKNATHTQRNKSITTKSSDELYSWLLATCIALTFLVTWDVSNQVCLKIMHKVVHVLTVIQVRIYIHMWWVHTRYKAQHKPISHAQNWLKMFVAHSRMLNPEMSYFLIPCWLLTLQLHIYTKKWRQYYYLLMFYTYSSTCSCNPTKVVEETT